jgi:hypothetical protein
MSGELFYGVSLWLIAVVMLGILVLVTEAGFRGARNVRTRLDETAKSQIGIISGAVLGLLALLLGFTFAMAQGRFELRQRLVLEESNDIRTAYLRTRLLPEPNRTEAADLLRSYVAARMDFYRAGADRERVEEAQNRTNQLQEQLWSNAVSAVAKDDREVTTGLFIESLKDVFDSRAKRFAAMDNHVPESVLLLLFIVALVAALSVGYGCGLGAHRHLFSTTMMTLLIVLVITEIIDLDRPRRGLIRVSQASMIHLQESMGPDARSR